MKKVTIVINSEGELAVHGNIAYKQRNSKEVIMTCDWCDSVCWETATCSVDRESEPRHRNIRKRWGEINNKNDICLAWYCDDCT